MLQTSKKLVKSVRRGTTKTSASAPKGKRRPTVFLPAAASLVSACSCHAARTMAVNEPCDLLQPVRHGHPLTPAPPPPPSPPPTHREHEHEPVSPCPPIALSRVSVCLAPPLFAHEASRTAYAGSRLRLCPKVVSLLQLRAHAVPSLRRRPRCVRSGRSRRRAHIV